MPTWLLKELLNVLNVTFTLHLQTVHEWVSPKLRVTKLFSHICKLSEATWSSAFSPRDTWNCRSCSSEEDPLQDLDRTVSLQWSRWCHREATLSLKLRDRTRGDTGWTPFNIINSVSIFICSQAGTALSERREQGQRKETQDKQKTIWHSWTASDPSTWKRIPWIGSASLFITSPPRSWPHGASKRHY